MPWGLRFVKKVEGEPKDLAPGNNPSTLLQ